MKYLLLLCLMFGLVSCGSDDPAPASVATSIKINVCNITTSSGAVPWVRLDTNEIATNLLNTSPDNISSTFTTESGNYTFTIDASGDNLADMTQTYALENNVQYTIFISLGVGLGDHEARLYSRSDNFADTSCPPTAGTRLATWTF